MKVQCLEDSLVSLGFVEPLSLPFCLNNGHLLEYGYSSARLIISKHELKLKVVLVLMSFKVSEAYTTL